MGLLKGPVRSRLRAEASSEDAPKSLAVAYSVRKQSNKGPTNRSLSPFSSAERPSSIAQAIRQKLRPLEEPIEEDELEDLSTEPLDTMDEMSLEDPSPLSSRVAAIRARLKGTR